MATYYFALEYPLQQKTEKYGNSIRGGGSVGDEKEMYILQITFVEDHPFMSLLMVKLILLITIERVSLDKKLVILFFLLLISCGGKGNDASSNTEESSSSNTEGVVLALRRVHLQIYLLLCNLLMSREICFATDLSNNVKEYDIWFRISSRRFGDIRGYLL